MRDALDPDHWVNGGECDHPHPDALAMEALDAENKQLRAEVERLKEARRWIPVSKAHPPANKMVLVCIGRWYHLTVSCIDQFGVWRGYLPTHWMPLPQPPKEVQG